MGKYRVFESNKGGRTKLLLDYEKRDKFFELCKSLGIKNKQTEYLICFYKTGSLKAVVKETGKTPDYIHKTFSRIRKKIEKTEFKNIHMLLGYFERIYQKNWPRLNEIREILELKLNEKSL